MAHGTEFTMEIQIGGPLVGCRSRDGRTERERYLLTSYSAEETEEREDGTRRLEPQTEWLTAAAKGSEGNKDWLVYLTNPFFLRVQRAGSSWFRSPGEVQPFQIWRGKFSGGARFCGASKAKKSGIAGQRHVVAPKKSRSRRLLAWGGLWPRMHVWLPTQRLPAAETTAAWFGL
ncbi:hypothetical protein VTJ49DRAFT_436 [Mycothermus thermophilus]|uniref:Uncharacterized protein n=1 Tax=Humicola insolens TaxID=85995 RepID=A0ABR3VFF1_HUMIN